MLLLIDLDDTLVDRSAAFASWATDFVARHNGTTDDVEWIIRKDRGGYCPRIELASMLKEHFGLPEDVPDVLQSIMGEHLKRVELYSGVEGALKEFRARGARIVVVTNGVTERQLIKYQRVGLEALTDAVVVSETVGYSKPHPAIFSAALELVPADTEVWMVGDNAIADVQGANDLGFSTAWISHVRHWPLEFSPSIIGVTPAQALDAVLAATVS